MATVEKWRWDIVLSLAILNDEFVALVICIDGEADNFAILSGIAAKPREAMLSYCGLAKNFIA